MDSSTVTGSQLRMIQDQAEVTGDMNIEMEVNTLNDELATFMKPTRPQTTEKPPMKGKPYSREIVVPQGPAGGIGAMVPRFAETAKYGSVRQKYQRQAET